MKLTTSHLEAAFRLGLDIGERLGRTQEKKLQNDLNYEPEKNDKWLRACYHEQRENLKKQEREIENDCDSRRWWHLPWRRDFRKWREKLELEAIERNKARLSGKRYRPKTKLSRKKSRA